MKREFTIKTSSRNELIDITSRVEDIIAESKIKSGIIMVYVPHTTAAVTINENADPSVRHDITEFLKKLIPENSGFTHSEGNSDAHIKSSLVGASESLVIEKGNPVLGRWQGIYFCEFDGPRTRRVIVKIISD
jgi:secondary thiamine-phosphate synthase enzyme